MLCCKVNHAEIQTNIMIESVILQQLQQFNQQYGNFE